MKTVNLLPPEIRLEIELSKKNAKLRQYVYFSVMSAIGLIVIYSLAAFFILTLKAETENQKAVATNQIMQQEADFNKAKDLYSRISLIRKIKKDSINWSLILEEIGRKTPAEVSLTTIGSNKTDLRIKLNGMAASDREVVAFKENLAKSEYFQFVDVESTSQGVDTAGREVRIFVLSFTLKAEKVKG